MLNLSSHFIRLQIIYISCKIFSYLPLPILSSSLRMNASVSFAGKHLFTTINICNICSGRFIITSTSPMLNPTEVGSIVHVIIMFHSESVHTLAGITCKTEELSVTQPANNLNYLKWHKCIEEITIVMGCFSFFGLNST